MRICKVLGIGHLVSLYLTSNFILLLSPGYHFTIKVRSLQNFIDRVVYELTSADIYQRAKGPKLKQNIRGGLKFFMMHLFCPCIFLMTNKWRLLVDLKGSGEVYGLIELVVLYASKRPLNKFY